MLQSQLLHTSLVHFTSFTDPSEYLRSLVSPSSLEWVTLAIDDMVHYQLNSSEAADEFARLLPPGGHLVYPDGADSPPYTLALFHQLRCLDIIRSDYATYAELSTLSTHCMHYLRQSVLCLADTRLEPARSVFGPRVVRFSSDYMCRDWEGVYAAAAAATADKTIR